MFREVCGSLAIVFNKLSRFSLPAVVVVLEEPALLLLNEEQIEALPNELYAALLNGTGSSTHFPEADGRSASNLDKREYSC